MKKSQIFFNVLFTALLTFLLLNIFPKTEGSHNKNNLQLKDNIQLKILNMYPLDYDDDEVIAVLNDTDMYTMNKMYSTRLAFVLPHEHHCFQFSIKSILDDGTISVYNSEKLCVFKGNNHATELTAKLHKNAVNFITVESYDPLVHYPSNVASFVIVTGQMNSSFEK